MEMCLACVCAHICMYVCQCHFEGELRGGCTGNKGVAKTLEALVCVCACVLLPVHRVLRQWQSCVDLHFEIEVLNRAVLVSYSQPPC